MSQQSYSLWLRLHPDDTQPLLDCQKKLAETIGSPPFQGHITLVPGIKIESGDEEQSNLQEQQIINKMIQGVQEAKESVPLSTDSHPNLYFSHAASQPNVWSQDIYLVVSLPNPFLQSLKRCLMLQYFGPSTDCIDDCEGWQEPCKVPHYSMVYGVHEEEIQRKGREEIIMGNDSNGKESKLLGEKNLYRLGTVELWKTGGGFEGIDKWEFIKKVEI